MPNVPWDDIPDYAVLPHDIYSMQVDQLTVTHSSKTGNLMIAAEYSVVAPATFVGMTVREWYVVGTEDDREAEDPETWKRVPGARNMRRLVKAIGITPDPDLEATCATLIGQQFDAMVTKEVEAEGDYAGRPRNRIQAYYRQGEQVPGSLSNGGSTAPRPRPPAPTRAAPAVARPVPTRPVTARPVTVVTEPYEEEVDAAPARPPMPSRPPVRR